MVTLNGWHSLEQGWNRITHIQAELLEPIFGPGMAGGWLVADGKPKFPGVRYRKISLFHILMFSIVVFLEAKASLISKIAG